MNNYTLIKNIVDDKELNSLDILEEKYNKIIEPGIILKTTKKIENLIPNSVKNLKNELGTNISEKELFIKMMKLVDEGFSKVEEIASKY